MLVWFVSVGTWGVAIFADDYACDVRAEWRDGILAGEAPEVLTHRLVQANVADEPDPAQAAVFWMALAAAQMETGRLDIGVRDMALAIIDAGTDIERWSEQSAALARQRRRVESRLAQKLRGPQPPPKRLRQPGPPGVCFDRGDVVHLRDPASGAEGLAVVVDHAEGWPRTALEPVVELVLWSGGGIPPTDELATLPFIHTQVPLLGEDAPGRFRPHLQVALTSRRRDAFGAHLGRLVATGVERTPSGDHRDGAIAGGSVLTSWTSWPQIAGQLGQDWFRADVARTRELLGG